MFMFLWLLYSWSSSFGAWRLCLCWCTALLLVFFERWGFIYLSRSGILKHDRLASFLSWNFSMACNCRSTKLFGCVSESDFCISCISSECFKFSKDEELELLDYFLMFILLSLSTESSWDYVRVDRIISKSIRCCFINFKRSSCFKIDVFVLLSFFLCLYILMQYLSIPLDY